MPLPRFSIVFSPLYLAFPATLLIQSCGGGGSSTENISSGQFVDSPVEGLSYQTPTQSGTTDAQGSFKYKKGEYISFKLGDVSLGGYQAKSILTPYDLTRTSLNPDTEAVNMARLLQTLDTDANPDNGISLGSNIQSLPATLDLSSESSIASALSTIDSSLNLVSTTTAEQHLNTTLGSLPPRVADGDAYPSVAIISSSFSSCNNRFTSASINIAQGVITGGTFTHADGTIETLVDSTTTDAGNKITSQRFDEYAGNVFIETGDSTGTGTCQTRIKFDTDATHNEPPYGPFFVQSAPRIELCNLNDPAQIISNSHYLGAFDVDGYFKTRMLFSYTIDGQQTVSLAGNLTPGFDNGYAEYLSDEFSVSLRCDQGYDWSVTYVDNEGETVTYSDRVDAQVSSTSTGTASDYAVCLEGYERAACSNLISTVSSNPTIQAYTAGSCSSLIPNPAATIDVTSQPDPSDPSWTLYPQIQVYSASTDPVSCYYEVLQ